jgi:hypothetical protein
MPENEHNPESEAGSQATAPARSEFPRFRGRKPTLLKLMTEQNDIYQKMLYFIRAGAYDYQVAQAIGIAPETFARWMSRGQESRKGLFRQFYQDIIAARSQCRILAEVQVRHDDPKYWLSHGPGKTRPGMPGWTDQVVVSGDEDMPITHQHNHRHDGKVEVIANAPSNELAASLAILNQLGIFKLTQDGQPSITGLGTVIESEGRISYDDEDEEGDDDDDDHRSDKGYMPDSQTDIDQIPQRKRH